MTSEHEDAVRREQDAWERLGDALSSKNWQAQENRYWADKERYHQPPPMSLEGLRRQMEREQER